METPTTLPTPRRMTAADLPQVQPLAARAFAALDAASGRPPVEPGEAADHYAAEHAHLHATAPEGCLVVDDGAGRVVGAALSYARTHVWTLALLVVDPDGQSTGIGSALLRQVLALAPAGVPRVLQSSRDPRAMRTYARAGFRLLPSLRAAGAGVAAKTTAPSAPLAHAERLGLDHLLVDLEHVVATGGLFVTTGSGPLDASAVVTGPASARRARVLSAGSPQAGAEAVRAALLGAGAAEGSEVALTPLPPQQPWAVDVALDLGLALSLTGPVAVAGVRDPLGPSTPPAAVLY